MLEESPLNSAPMLSPRLPRISVPFAPEKKGSATKDRASTELFLNSCAKEVTSPTTTEPVESVRIGANGLF